MSTRRPTVTTDEISLTKVRINLLVDGLVPKGSNALKNGTIRVELDKGGINFTASVKSNDGKTTEWAYKVKKLPSEINVDKSSWKAEKGKVVVDLVKTESVSWEAMMRRGLDQADSSSDED